ncbi:hypothetical protein KKF86_09060 [bacterium]|nr:hypothetical protein [bacterium]
MNPFLKHPILQFVGYEMMKRPTLEEIKRDIKKESEKGKWSVWYFTIFYLIYSIKEFYYSKLYTGVTLLLIGLSAYFVFRKQNQSQLKRFKISDTDILEQIEIHKEWNNAKS